MNTKVEIPLSKISIPIIFLLVLGVIGVLAFLTPETFASNTPKNPDYISTMGIVAAGISFLLIIPFARKLFSKKMGLTIDKDGITDISNATYTELIEWNDITGIKKVKNGPIKSIVLLTDKPEKYINRAKKISRPTMQKAQRFNGSPIMLVSSRLNIKYDDLVDLITKEFEKAKRTTA